MLAAGEVAGKVVLVHAHVTTDVALKWMFVAMATHVDGVENIVREANVTVLTLLQEVLVRGRQRGGRCARLAVADANSEGVHAVLKVQAGNRTAGVVAGIRRSLHSVQTRHLFTGDVLYEDGLLFSEGLVVRGHRSLRLLVEVGQLASEGGELVQRVLVRQTIPAPDVRFVVVHPRRVLVLTAV